MGQLRGKEKIRILKELFAIPESEAWKWQVKVYDRGAIGIGRLSLDEINKTEVAGDVEY